MRRIANGKLEEYDESRKLVQWGVSNCVKKSGGRKGRSEEYSTMREEEVTSSTRKTGESQGRGWRRGA